MSGGTGQVLFSKVSARVPALLLASLLWSGNGFGLAASATLPEDMGPQASCLLSSEDQLALELGRKVSAVAEVLKDPGKPGAMQAVVELGLDQRYYGLVRGWLSQQLRGDLSVRDASAGQTPDLVEKRIKFLERAIRAIDLE